MDRATRNRCENVYRTIGGRCAVRFADLELGIPAEQAQEILERLGITFTAIDVVALARAQVGKKYRRGAKQHEAPEIFDCSSFTKWVYAQAGVWLPRYSIDQRSSGIQVQIGGQRRSGDLTFTPGAKPWHWGNPVRQGVGHVGIYTEAGTVIHAANSKRGVVEEELLDFWGNGPSRGFRRVIVPDTKTAIVPPELEVEYALQLRWMVLQRLPKQGC